MGDFEVAITGGFWVATGARIAVETAFEQFNAAHRSNTNHQTNAINNLLAAFNQADQQRLAIKTGLTQTARLKAAEYGHPTDQNVRELSTPC